MAGLKQFKFIPQNLLDWSKWMRDQEIENALGNPTADGYILSSTTEGVRTWVADTARTNLVPATLCVPTATTSQLTDIDNNINLSNKAAGKMYFNTTTSKPVFAVGAMDSDVWVDATGATVHTPS